MPKLPEPPPVGPWYSIWVAVRAAADDLRNERMRTAQAVEETEKSEQPVS